MLTLLLSAIIGIVCGILANLSTPFARLTFSRVLDRSRQRRLQTLERTLNDVRIFCDDPTDFHTYLLGQVFVVLCAFGISLFLLIATAAYYPIIERSYLVVVACAWPSASFGAGRAYWTVVMVSSVRRFHIFEP
jgi:hypothetical protein